MTYSLTVPNTKANRRVTLAILQNFSNIQAEFTAERAAEGIRLTTDSAATWAGAVAAFEEPLCIAS